MDRRGSPDDRRGARRDERQPARTGPRIPPHNLQAEESVLGALLLSREAIGAVSEQGLRPDDFYKPGNQHVFDAVRALYSTGAPADVITVADELRRAGLLDQIGGVEALHALQNATPAISNAGHYARIVQDTALLRRLIHVAGDIAELAYGEPDDVTKAVDEAETKVFKVAEDRVADSTLLLSESIKGVMDRLEETFARGDTITGTATGYHDIDELLSGLQPSTLNIVGARPAMGKCVAWDTPIVDLETGELITARELAERAARRVDVAVRALDADGRQRTWPVGGCIHDGVKPVFRVRTSGGRVVSITAAHPLLTARGWRPLQEVMVGEDIAVPTNFPVFGTDDLTDTHLDLLTGSADDERLPRAVFRLPRRRLARFLQRLFATSGWTLEDEAGAVRIGCRAGREARAHDIAHALLRFGIRTTVARRSVDPGGRRGREAAVFDVELVDASCGSELDTIPPAVWDDIDKAKGDTSWVEINRRCGRAADDDWFARRGRVPRATVVRLAEVLDDDQLAWWASPDVGWDPIVEITPLAATEVIDFTVPGAHNFVAADVYLHNTAFGLGMATHVAQTSARPVLVFSLEMGHHELTQRILSSEAKVDSSKMRNGRLSEADWAKIGRAIGRLEVPLFLDDNPRVTVMEIRAKARRLKARHGALALIVIDYLQLMTGGGNPENRQLEVSDISRNLKILARELEVPIVALSQLSRAVETRSDKRPMLADLRESGCLTADTMLVRADTGEQVALGALVGHTDVPVLSLDEHYRVVPARLVRAFASGRKPTFRLRLASGRSIDASANHPFLTVGGWRPVESLAAGEHLAVADPTAIRTDRSGALPAVDRVPAAVWDHIRTKSLPAAGLTTAALAAALGMCYCGGALERFRLTRSRLTCIAAVTDDAWLHDLATAHVAWDRIMSITPLGEQPVFDATIATTHNFLANDIVAHNSLEQDADVVMFLYRDEVYNNESPDKGSAEVIVAKHRSGPIGTKRLVFLGQYTRFDNAARGV
ncbi:MAG: replicative DNA helicase [Ilumatobacteraceae bacterium]